MKITKTVLLIVLFLVLVFLMTGPTIVHACTDNGAGGSQRCEPPAPPTVNRIARQRYPGCGVFVVRAGRDITK